MPQLPTPFLPALATWLRQAWPQPLELAKVTVWLPTRPAALALKQELLKSQTPLFPRIRLLQPHTILDAPDTDSENGEENPTLAAAAVQAWRSLHPQSSPAATVGQALPRAGLCAQLAQHGLTPHAIAATLEESHAPLWQPQLKILTALHTHLRTTLGHTWQSEQDSWQHLATYLQTADTPQVFAGFTQLSAPQRTALEAARTSPHTHILTPHVSSLTPQASRLETPHLLAEAEAIAAHVQTLPPEASVTLVTPSAALAQRVQNTLALAGHGTANGFGIPLAHTPAGALLAAALDAAQSPTAPALATFFLNPHIAQICSIPLTAFQGPTPTTLADWHPHLAPHHALAAPLLATLQTNPLTITNHIPTFSTLLGADEVTALLATLPNLSPPDAAALATQSLQSLRLRIPPQGRPRLTILTPTQAQLAHADVLILGACNDDLWAPNSPHPVLSQRQLKALGLPTSEDTRTFLHTVFTRLTHSASHVLLTRHTHTFAGEETLPAASWSQLQTPIQNAETPAPHASHLTPHASSLPLPQSSIPARLSPSLLATLMACPYRAALERILHLQEPAPFAEAPDGPLTTGNLLHTLIGAFWRSEDQAADYAGFPPPFTGPLTPERQTEALQIWNTLSTHLIAQQPPLVQALWQNRTHALGQALIAHWLTLQGETPSRPLSEIWLKDSNWHARADAVFPQEASATLVDYKTGTPPTWADVTLGLAPQLTLEALLWNAEHPTQPVEKISYLKLRTHAPCVTESSLTESKLSNALTATAAGAPAVREHYTQAESWPATPHTAGAGTFPGGHCEKCPHTGICRLNQLPTLVKEAAA